MSIQVQNFTYRSYVNMDTIYVEIYADGKLVRTNMYSTVTYTITLAENDSKSQAEGPFGVMDNKGNLYEKASTPPTTPETSKPPQPQVEAQPAVNFDDKIYVPKSSIKKPKTTDGTEFVVLETQQFYSGSYVKTSQKQYFAGKTVNETGIELQKVRKGLNVPKLTPSGILVGAGLLAMLLKTVFTKQPSSSDLFNGKTSRFFVKDTATGKIAETDEQTAKQLQAEIPNIKIGSVDWIIQGPAEDRMFGIYKYEGAISRNEKAIEKLEKDLPGISSFVTDYAFLVKDPVQENMKKGNNLLSSEVFIEKDPNTELENSRKANFDKKN
jgi:hypothetical protein